MRRYTAKDEDDLIKQIESDPELDKGWEPPVEGHVVEIRYVDVAERARLVKLGLKNRGNTVYAVSSGRSRLR